MDQNQIEEHAQGYASMVGRLAGCMAGVSSRARLEGMLKALERTRTAITEELDKQHEVEICSCGYRAGHHGMCQGLF